MADLKITDEIREIINQCRFDGNKVFLPNIQLDRKLYTQVNALFAELKGVWSRKEKAHIFPSDPREKLGILAAQDKLIDQKKARQAFYTPQDLVEEAVKWADVKDQDVLEPSCGDGRFIRECLKQGAQSIDAVELDQETAEQTIAEFSGQIVVYAGDFLTFDPSKNALYLPEYDVILGNPPYNHTDWLKHTLHAYKFVKPNGGRLVFILPNSIHSNKKFQEFVADKKWEYREVEAGRFKESGTSIATNIVKIWK